MKGAQRTVVLWLGTASPGPFRTALEERGCSLEAIAPGGLAPLIAKARALAVPFEGDVGAFRARARKARDEVLDHGLGLVFCAAQTVDPVSFAPAVQDLDKEYPSHRMRRLPHSWTELAEWIARYDPGPDFEVAPRMDNLPTAVSGEDQLLLARAFSDFEQISVRALTPGYSGASVLVVHPVKQSPGEPATRLLPYVVKFGDRDDIEGERVSYWQHIAGKIPFNHRPNIDQERCVEGSHRALMVQDFVDGALPLSAAVGGGNPLLLLASVFECALRDCRLARTTMAGSIAGSLNDLRVFKWTPDLDASAVLAKAEFSSNRSPADLRSVVDAMPNSSFAHCTIHGDLHAGNVFVGSASGHAILIDFAKSSMGPAVADPAALEVSLAFPPEGQEVPAELEAFAQLEPLLEDLYSDPISIPGGRGPFGPERWLWEVVRGIRILARVIEPPSGTPDAYTVAVAGNLLRFASYGVNLPMRRRALAYALAERLLT